MTDAREQKAWTLADPATWFVLALSAAFVCLGMLFLFSPQAGAALFGIAAPDRPGLLYVAAIGLRDLALGLYLAVLVFLATPRAVGAILGVTVLIPLGDVLLVFFERGLTSPSHLALHAGSALIMAAGAAFLLRRAPQNKREDA